MTEEDHIQLLETIVHCSAQIMISGYDTPLYNDYLHTWDTLRIPNQTTSGVVREEIVWMNYTHQLSLYDFGNAGYISMYLQSTRGKIILVSVIVALFIAGLILPQEKNQEEVKNE